MTDCGATPTVVPEESLIDVPEGVPLEHAADKGVAGATAWCTVTEIAKVTPDDRVLILGAGATPPWPRRAVACRVPRNAIGSVRQIGFPPGERSAARTEGSVDRPLPASRPDVVLLEPHGYVFGFDG